MCLGVPAKIIRITDKLSGKAVAETDGVRREVSLAMLLLDNQQADELVGRWVLLHVGFAMAVINEEEATQSLRLLREMSDD